MGTEDSSECVLVIGEGGVMNQRKRRGGEVDSRTFIRQAKRSSRDDNDALRVMICQEHHW